MISKYELKLMKGTYSHNRYTGVQQLNNFFLSACCFLVAKKNHAQLVIYDKMFIRWKTDINQSYSGEIYQYRSISMRVSSFSEYNQQS